MAGIGLDWLGLAGIGWDRLGYAWMDVDWLELPSIGLNWLGLVRMGWDGGVAETDLGTNRYKDIRSWACLHMICEIFQDNTRAAIARATARYKSCRGYRSIANFLLYRVSSPKTILRDF